MLVKYFYCFPWMGCPEMHENVSFNKYYYLYNPAWNLCTFLSDFVIFTAFLSSPFVSRFINLSKRPSYKHTFSKLSPEPVCSLFMWLSCITYLVRELSVLTYIYVYIYIYIYIFFFSWQMRLYGIHSWTTKRVTGRLGAEHVFLYSRFRVND